MVSLSRKTRLTIFMATSATTCFSLQLVFIFVFLLSCFLPLARTDISGDKDALLAFRSAVGPSLRWNQSEATPCSWHGVECRHNRVVALRLPGAGLIGDFPPGVLGNLTELRTLSLRFNALSGPLPPDLSRLTSLRSLHLQSNRLSGQIVPAVSDLRRLVRLNLAENNFSGLIPPSFRNLTRLVTLLLDSNSLSGPIPDLQLPNLTQFNVSFNRLNGPIPESLSRLADSAFAGNVALCGAPLSPCPFAPPPTTNSPTGNTGDGGITNSTNNGSADGVGQHRRLSGGAIAGIVIACAVVAVFVLYICVACARKRQGGYRRTRDVDMITMKTPPRDPAVAGKPLVAEQHNVVNGEFKEYGADAASGTGGGKKLLFFPGAKGGFDLEDLLRASAEVLGKGTFGTAYKAQVDNGSVVAVKRLKDVNLSLREFTTTIKRIGTASHENLVPLRAYYYSKEEKLLVYDYMPMGSLSALLHGSRGAGRTPLNWETRSRIALGAARGIEYLHSQRPNISHGNIKASNVLLTKDYDCCISDFGLATLVTSIPAATRVIGYRAPEVTDPSRVSQEADVYSFGVLLLELLTGKPPAHALLNEEGVDLPRWVQSVVREEWASEVFDLELLRHGNVEEDKVQLLQLAMDCASGSPDQRPTMREVVRRIEEMRQNIAEGAGIEVLHSSQRTVNSIEDTASAGPPTPGLFD